jgi:filamentous hemagglutinin family protein
MMKNWINPFWIGSVVFGFWANVTTASAQVVPDNTLPVNSQVTGCPVCQIDGGTVRGVNLFHSFEEFSVQTGGEAFFNNALQIENIFGRVTGSNISDIDGLIRANGTANLFLINPNGIIFSENAQLNVGGSFVASTANAIGFGNQGVFSATNPEAPPLLTVNPDVLFFNQLAAQGASSIEVRGALSVPSGESLLLVGGNVVPSSTSTGELLIDGGTLTAPGGRVELAGVSVPGAVGLVADNGSLELDFPADLARTDISIFGSTIDVAGAGGGDIVIYAKDLTIGSSLVGNQPDLGETYTLQVSIENQELGNQNSNQETEPNNSIHRGQNLDGSFSVAANPDVESSTTIPSVSIAGTGDGTFDYYSFTVETPGSQGIFDIDQGNTGGAGSLDTELFLFDAQGGLLASNDDSVITQGAGGSLSTTDSYISFNFETPGTYVIGVGKFDANSEFSRLRAGIASGLGSVDAQAGNITIDATGRVAVAEGVIRNNVEARATGRGGDVRITGSSLSVTNGALISASTFGQGNAGQVLLRVTDSILLDGEDSQGFSSGVLSTVQPEAQGNSGGVDIDTASLTLTNGGQIAAITFGEGDAGEIVIRATDSILLDGESSQGFSSVVFSTVASDAKGNSRGIEIDTGSLTLNNGTYIDTSIFGEGDAGQIVIRANDSILLDGEDNQGLSSSIVSSVASNSKGNFGGIEIDTSSLILNDGAVISASTRGEGDAGEVIIRARDNILLDGESSQGLGSRILSQVASGVNGSSRGIEINTGSLTLKNGAEINTSTQGEGDAGQIKIMARDNIILDGESSQGFLSGVFSRVLSGANGDSLGIEINTDSLIINNGALISSSTFEEGDAGKIDIRARDSILLDGEHSQGLPSRILSNVLSGAKGDSGGVEINTGSLILNNGTLINTSTLGEGDAGKIKIRVRDNILLDGESSQGFPSSIFSTVTSGAKGNSQSIEINTGSLILNNGAVINASTAGEGDAGKIEIRTRDNILLDGESSQRFSSSIFSTVLSGAKGNSQGIEINTESLTLNNGTRINASTAGEGDAGKIEIRARDNILLDGESSQGFSSHIFSTVQSGAKGNAGSIEIDTDSLTLSNGGVIATSTFGEGNAGKIAIQSTDSILFDGESSQGLRSGVFSTVQSGANGDSLGIEIESDSLTLSDGGVIITSTFGEGDAGKIAIRATDSILFYGESTQGNGSSIFSTVESEANGNAGSVEIDTGSLILNNGGAINSSTLGAGNAGKIDIHARDSIRLNGESSQGFSSGVFSAVASTAKGNSLGIEIDTGSLTLNNGAQISAETESTGMAGRVRINATEFIELIGDSSLSVEATQGGIAGDLMIKTTQMSVRDGASVTVSSPSGQAGNLGIWADSLVLDQGQLTAETGISGVEGGANITLQDLETLILTNESLISAQAFDDANGGNIDIESIFLLTLPPEGVNGSDIIASAQRGDGGRITITSQGIFGIEERPAIPGNRTNDIDASSQFGNPGEITLDVSLDPSRGLTQLPSTLVDPSGQINRTCAASNRQSQFTVTGRGGLPENPTDLFSPDLVQDDFGTVIAREEDGGIEGQVEENNSPISHPPKQIIEAQGWIIDAEGNVVLTAYVPNGTPHGGWQNSVNCQVSETASP